MNLTDIAVGAASATAALGALGKPILILRDKRFARERAKSELDVALNGEKAIPGVRNAVLSLPLRVAAAESTLAQLSSDVQSVVKGLGLLEQRMDEANGTSRRIEGMVKEIRDI